MLFWFVVTLELLAALLAASHNFNFGDGKQAWTPQRGSTKLPKSTALSSVAERGDVFDICGQLFRAKFTHYVDDSVDCGSGGPEAVDPTMWQKVEPGRSLLEPLRLTDADGGLVQFKAGDIIYDEINRKHYRATSDGQFSDWSDVQAAQKLEEPSTLMSDWMSSLRPLIGDKRFGDVIVPGTHDSGSWNITEDSYLVDRNFLYQLGDLLTPNFIANWSRTQTEDLQFQLEAGFRNLDLRVADMETVDGSFRWWHGMTGDRIEEGLGQIADFIRAHPEEILQLTFQHFASPGNTNDSTLPIPDNRKDVLSDILLSYLGPYMAPKSALSDNPTMNEVLGVGANIIATMQDDYIRVKDDRYWPVVVVSSWTGVENPEDLFAERSSKLRIFHDSHADSMTDISGCVTAGGKTIIAALTTVYGNETEFYDFIEEVAPGFHDINPQRMSFEGLFLDLVSTARFGTNTDGMWARPAELYSSGASTNYRGTEDMLPHWLARPGLYKVNIIYADDIITSRFVDIAISANRGDIGRAVSISYQGNTLDGYYVWNGLDADGGQAAQNCSTAVARYRVTSAGFQIRETWIDLLAKTSATFVEGFYPPDAEIQLQVSGQHSATSWMDIFVGNIQQMIDFNEDVYLRATDMDDGSGGFAYTSYTYDLFGPPQHCQYQPTGGYLAMVQW